MGNQALTPLEVPGRLAIAQQLGGRRPKLLGDLAEVVFHDFHGVGRQAHRAGQVATQTTVIRPGGRTTSRRAEVSSARVAAGEPSNPTIR